MPSFSGSWWRGWEFKLGPTRRTIATSQNSPSKDRWTDTNHYYLRLLITTGRINPPFI